jgi:photosystem II stability/assembly factor-like uncharacterized protein
MKTGILISLTALLVGLQFAAAQGTAFTYQGRLIDGTNSANGSYDLSFTLYDDATAGNVLGSVTNYATAVSNGLFSVTLDFGPGVFTGASSNWLDIAVATNGGSVFTELTPRQQVLPVPYAIRAASAAVADTALTAASAGTVYATNITGTIGDAQLSTNVALLNGNPTFAGTVTANSFAGSGAGLTNVPGTFRWTVVSNTSVQLQSNLGYLSTANSLVNFTLPPTTGSIPGDMIYISSGGLGGWKILQNAGQSIKSPNSLLNYSTWTNRPVPNAAWTGVACSTNGQRIMGVNSSSGNGTFVISTDSGITWRSNYFAQLYSVASSADGSILYLGEYNSIVNISTDSGTTWASTSISTSFLTVSGLVCSADGIKVYAAGSSGSIYYSPDSGADWFQRPQSGNGGIACSSDGSKVVVANSSGTVFTSSNFGANWTQRSIQARYIACSSDGNKIIAAQNGGAVYLSSDFGATWTQQNLPSPNWSAVASSADGTRLVATANGGAIYTSTDSGTTWIAQNSGSRNWSCVACSSDGAKLIAGVNFGQIWTSQLSTTTGTTTGTSGYLQGVSFSTIQLLYMGSGIWNTITSSGTVFAY